MPGSGLCLLATLRHHANLQARNALRQGFAFLSASLCGLSVSALSLALRIGTPPVRDNACALPKHLLTVEMLPGPVRDGPLL